jgi:hypothetical protein
MGSNMQRQSVPLLFPQAPLVGTGLEEKVARDSGAVIAARRGGVVTRVTADEIIIDSGEGQSPIGDQPLTRLAPGGPLPGQEVLAHQPGHRASTSGPWSRRASGSPTARSWPTAPPPKPASWRWAAT